MGRDKNQDIFLELSGISANDFPWWFGARWFVFLGSLEIKKIVTNLGAPKFTIS